MHVVVASLTKKNQYLFSFVKKKYEDKTKRNWITSWLPDIEETKTLTTIFERKSSEISEFI